MKRKEAIAIYQAGQAPVVDKLCELSAKVDEQAQKIAVLEKNSTNSSKPPSSDITKPPKKPKSGKKNKQGGQPGHPKHERTPFSEEEIDEHLGYHCSSCPECDSSNLILLDEQPKIIQQVELQEVVTHIEEHRAYACYCEDCDQIHYAPFPDEVVKAGLFKERLTALVAYMKNGCHASFSTIRKFLRDVIGVPVSRGYLSKLIQKVSHALAPSYEQLLDRIPLETNLNIDETGHKDNGDLFWTWVFKADLYVLFRIDKSRGSKVLIEMLGREFDGTIGCDYLSTYRKYMKDFNVMVQFCIAHLIRDIKFLTTLPDAQTQAYGKKLLSEVKRMFKHIHNAEQMSENDFQSAMEKTKARILRIAINEAPSRINEDGKEELNHAQNIANRFRLHGEAYFRFITTPGMDPTNNVAEQAIRFIVIDRYVTQGTRSAKGREANERLWTVIGTCALQGRSAYNFILQAVHAYFYDEPAPSLLPGST
ncbi:MAG: IS66 family transposase [Gammaproteobacteria bacterium]|nr:IS66 family transposase [Gammaproteobacteria bacterium]